MVLPRVGPPLGRGRRDTTATTAVMALSPMHGHAFQWIAGLAALGFSSAALSGAQSAASEDQIELRNFPPTAVVMLLDGLQDGWIFDKCVNDRIHLVPAPPPGSQALLSGSVKVPVKNFIPFATLFGIFPRPLMLICPPEVAAFASERAMLLDVHPGWTNSASDVVVEPLAPPLDVKLNVRVPTGHATALAFAQGEVWLAGALFRQNRTGLKLDATITATAGSFMGTSNGCADITAVQAAGVYQADRLNVYFVNVLLNPSGIGTDYGRNCFLGGAPNIIFVSVSDHVPVTLAHEIGHGLWLLHTNMGYPNSYPGFTSVNIMYDAADATAGQARHYFSLGQGYRLNVHSPSWLNSPVGGAPALRTGPTKTCQPIDSPAKQPCPWGALAWP